MTEIEIVKLLNELDVKELERTIFRAKALLEKKKQMEAEREAKEKERQRLEEIEKEKKRQEEIAALQQRLKELQRQGADVQPEPDNVRGDGFVMYPPASVKATPAAAPAQHTASAQPQPPKTIPCPLCRQANPAGSVFCASCGQRIAAQPAAPSTSAPTQPKPATAPAASHVRYADESMKKWEMLPGEKIQRAYHEVQVILPNWDRKYTYFMEVTNNRILFSRMSVAAASAGVAFGLIGSLVREAAGAGPKPWLEIPLSAITNCGVQNKKEFFIDAEQTFVLKNKGYQNFLPELVINAKSGR